MFDYLSITKDEHPIAAKMFEQPQMDGEYFRLLADAFRSPHLWKLDGDKWELRRAVWHDGY